jgi:protease secretion system membrane fusion protein
MNGFYEDIENDVRPRRWGWIFLAIGFGGFLVWAWLAPLDAGVSAPGMVVITGNRKAVQPVVGGKIVAILAKDGDTVTDGQKLVQLDDTQSRSQLEIAKGQWFTALATESRLHAERMGLRDVEFHTAITSAKSDDRAITAMSIQRQLFQTRRATLASELSAMSENLKGLELQTSGTEASKTSKKSQLRLLNEQLRKQSQLADEGFIARNRVLDLQRTIAATEGSVAEDIGNIGRGGQAIAEMRMRMVTRQQEFRREVESQLPDIQKEASSLGSRLEALQFDLANTVIKSPAHGVVMGLAVHTIGGVVAAGSPMMEIVPTGTLLRIDAQIAPHLIDKVNPGQSVDILFVALNQITTPRIPGMVMQVSADVMSDPKQNQTYFKATVEVTPEGLNQLKSNEIRAGMPVEVFVKTGERSALSYFVKPLIDRLGSALTEP